MSTLEPRIVQGTCIADRYVVEGMLGQGGLGIVLAVRDLVTGAPVALKLLKAKTATDHLTVERFIREARMLMSLDCEHIVRVLDAGSWRGAPFLVMERLVGESLSTHLRGFRVSPRTAADIAIQVCIALAHAHARGIVHRDVTPANVFLTQRPDGSMLVKLLDFGISKTGAALGAADHSLTSTGVLLGSPRYMSPEQIADAKRVDARSDIWSVGVLLYRAITGSDLFRGSSMVSIVCAVLNDPIEPMAARGVAVPRELEGVVSLCLKRQIESRFQDVATLAFALAPYASPYWAAEVRRIPRIFARTSSDAFDLTQPLPYEAEVAFLRAQRNHVTRKIKLPRRRRLELAMTALASFAVFATTLAFLVSR